MRTKRAAHPGDMRVGLGEPGTAEREPRQVAETVVGKVEVGVLARENDHAVEPARGERGGDRG